MKRIPGTLGTVRASSWPTLFDCSLRWYYSEIMELKKPMGGSGQLGTALHKSTATYDKPRMTGETASAEAACDALVDTIRKPDREVIWADDLTADKAEKIGLQLTTNYIEQIAPTREYKAVEVLCDALDVNTDDGIIRLSGTTDRIRITKDRHEGISDLKSGKTAVNADGVVNTKGHHLQTGIYRILAEAALDRVLDAPDEIIGMQVNGKARVGVAEIRDSRTPLVGNEDSPGLISIAARMLKTGVFPPNPKSMLCSEKYCTGYSRCPYHD